IDTIGIGSPEGQPIPLRDASGALIGYKKDKSGATVISKLGEKDLAAIAQETGGRYYRSTPGASEALEIAQAATQAGSEGKSRGTTRRFKNHFMAPLAMAFLLLLAEWLIPETSGAPTLTALCLLALWPTGARAATAESHLRQGNKLYDAQKYQPALEQYGQAAAKSPRDARPIFNAGDALYRLERYDKAAEAFKSVAKGDSSAAARAGAYYNLGDSYFQQQDYASAVAAYRRALSLNPDDPDSRRNLAVALRFQRHPPPKRKKSGKNGNRQRQPQKPQPKDRSSNGGSKPPPPKPQPRDQMSKEDAERIMQAVSEREKAPRPARAARRKSETEEDW
ncbi:MAG: tetratricopeptide repeat protein, partial [Elusimicrobia bacterium]|nr:tetratricopeptide repeat protein [Elusimicrobiota bacterium]